MHDTAREPELLHDAPTTDPHAWQRPELLAELLGVNERTIRKLASRGEVERLRVNGRVYYRQTRPQPDAEHRDEGPERAEHGPELHELRLALVALQRDYAATVERLRDELLEARVATERTDAARREAELLADVAVRDAERHLAELLEARQRADTAGHRARLLEAAAALPWYAWRRRRALLEAAGVFSRGETVPALELAATRG